MQLYYSHTSPYARKCRLALREKGLEQQVEEILCDPFQELPALRRANPLHRVPTLVLDNGSALFDSPVICQYLDSLAPRPRLIPAGDPERWAVLRWEALADGMVDAAYDSVMERRRPAVERSAHWLASWEAEIGNALTAAEQWVGTLPPALSLAQLALAAALGYLDLRLGQLNWRDGCPQVAAWYDDFSRRPAFRATSPL
jgi:glutathione S-transferase